MLIHWYNSTMQLEKVVALGKNLVCACPVARLAQSPQALLRYLPYKVSTGRASASFVVT